MKAPILEERSPWDLRNQVGVQTMIRATWCAFLVALLVAGIDMSGAQTPPARFDSTTPTACGPLVRWRMPRTTVVEATPRDSRQIDVLVTQARIDAVILAAEAYCRLNRGVYPTTFEEMESPPDSFFAAMKMCRIDADASTDSWGRPIFYAVIAGRLIVHSAGMDGRFTTADDISIPLVEDQHAETFNIETECTGVRPHR